MSEIASTAAVRGWLQQIGLELAAFAMRPERPPTALVAAVTEIAAAAAGGPPEIAAAVAAATAWTAAPMTDDLRERWAGWHEWMDRAVTAWDRGRPLPSWPATASGRTPPVAAPLADQAVPLLPEGADAELMRLFCADAEDYLRDIEQGVLVLETQPDDPETLNTVFRAFHTFKGNAGMLKLVALQRVAHELESLLDAARRGGLRLGPPEIDVVLAAADVFARYVGAVVERLAGRRPTDTVALPVAAVLAGVQAAVTRQPGEPAPSAVATGMVATPEMAEPAVPAVATAAGKLTADIAVPASGTAEPRPGVTTGSVRVDTGKLDGLIDLVGELVIAQSLVTQSPALATVADEELARSAARLRGICAELQRTATALRMLPVRGTFQKMARLVRDVAAQLGKEIRLVLAGEETEVDRAVVEELADPLIHMIRNAVDHGIESPAERGAVGKPRQGTITLRASHRGGFVVVEVEDDGRGLDPARLRRRAEERGLIRAAERLSDHESLELIFMPGFSTAERVSEVSGRGVGMDVVRRNIERIRGQVAIASRPGEGTVFTVSIPLTLAVIEGLLVAVGDQRFVIPTLAVRESFRPAAAAVTTVQGRGEVVAVRGRLVPLLRLARQFGIPGAVSDPTEGIVVVAEAGAESRCLLVDALVGKQDVVIKSLGESFPPGLGFAGAAILADGRVGLILDTTALVRTRITHPETAA